LVFGAERFGLCNAAVQCSYTKADPLPRATGGVGQICRSPNLIEPEQSYGFIPIDERCRRRAKSTQTGNGNFRAMGLRMTALEVIDDLLGRKLLDWTTDELVATRVRALNGTLPSDEENYWRKVHARLKQTETGNAEPPTGGEHTRLTWARTESSFTESLFTAKQALINLRYAPGIVVETSIALWLLSHYSDWLLVLFAYLLILASAVMTIAGFVWYGLWFAQRGFGIWFFLITPFVIGVGLIIAAQFYRVEIDWIKILVAITTVFILPLPVYCAWRLLKFTIMRLFRILLIAASQLGSAWRGELHR
jgi:hypothetical protein